MANLRKAAVASLFYPDEKINLKRMIKTFLSNVPPENAESFIKSNVDRFLGVIVPHAGYAYSGQVAAFGYSLFKEKSPDTVILIGPSHYTYFEGLALSDADFFETPLGNVEIDKEFSESLVKNSEGLFDYIDSAHEKEHSIEVQLPFLQSTLINNFKIVPVLMAEQSLESIRKAAGILNQIIQDHNKNVLFVISSDLSHYHEDGIARDMDAKIIDLIKNMDIEKLMAGIDSGEIEACGAAPIALLLEIAKLSGHQNVKDLIYQNSGDVSGDTKKVVGYFSGVVW